MKSNHVEVVCQHLKNNQSSHTHTFKPPQKFFFFLNILKIFHNTIEVYEKIFKVECTKHKPV